jgi:hypothetical protein
LTEKTPHLKLQASPVRNFLQNQKFPLMLKEILNIAVPQMGILTSEYNVDIN